MQTILGAGGVIGRELAQTLQKYTPDIRLVSRNPQKVNEGDQLHPADLRDPGQTDAAVAGSEVAYLTVGLPYRYQAWKSDWPVIMENVIEACRKHATRLVFFDNIYMYEGECLDPITESLPLNPPSNKGQVRAQIATRLMDHVQNGSLQALIARSADFYGPGTQGVSMLMETVIKPLAHNKKANWLGGADKKHSFTFTPDAARAVALLGNTEKAYGEVWHLPTASEPFTGAEWVRQIAEVLEVDPRYRVVGKGMVRFLGLFNPMMRESVEMMYQYDRDYVFDSTKFESTFDLKPTPYAEGIRQTVGSLSDKYH